MHSFDIDIAKNYGVNAAILYSHIQFWTARNEANNENYYDGSYWTYNSGRAFAELFPYMTKRQIEYALKTLVDGGVLKTGNYNKSNYDRTLWYAITDFGKSISHHCEMDATPLGNGCHNHVTPIPDSKPDRKQADIKPDTSKKVRSKKDESYDSIISDYTEDEELKAVLIEFVKMRQRIRKPMTNYALKLMLKKIDGLSNTNAGKVCVINQSIINGWQDVYQLKGGETNAKPVRSDAGNVEPYERGIGWNKIL